MTFESRGIENFAKFIERPGTHGELYAQKMESDLPGSSRFVFCVSAPLSFVACRTLEGRRLKRLSQNQAKDSSPKQQCGSKKSLH